MGVPKTIGSDIPNLIKNVSNFVQDVPTVPKYVLRWGSAPNHFLMGSKMKSWTLGTLFTKFGTSFIKFGTSDPIASENPI